MAVEDFCLLGGRYFFWAGLEFFLVSSGVQTVLGSLTLLAL
jgi:hypothetical protein